MGRTRASPANEGDFACATREVARQAAGSSLASHLLACVRCRSMSALESVYLCVAEGASLIETTA